jgi:lipopolysaccharide/colanic/teichoic acid biosynthesis glycosyltransferase
MTQRRSTVRQLQQYESIQEEHESIVPNTKLGYLISKRIIDIVFSLFALIITLPVSIATVVAIKIEKPRGGVIYKQIRVGKDGKLFTFFKFRSMIQNSDMMQTKLQQKSDPYSPFFKIKNDPRVTKVGSFIRKYSIDELPQFINILKGDMTIVGPRPLQPHEAEGFPGYLANRQKVLPGLTCYWQVEERSNGIPHSRMENDLRYVRNQSLKVDVKLLVQTIPAVFSGKGAA